MGTGMSVTAARAVAYEVVTRVTRDGAWVPEVLDTALKARTLGERDVSFATRLSYGTIEMLATIDAVVLQLADRPGRIRPRVMNALRIAAYELLWLGTPSAVAVDQGVEMVRAKYPHAAGFANALLRRVAERAPEFPWGDPETDGAALARLTGFPVGMAEYLSRELGAQRAAAFMRACSEPAPFYLGANPFRASDDELAEELAAAGAGAQPTLPPGCFSCDAPRAVLSSAVLEEGHALVCDASAQLVASLPAALGARTVVDVGAGRGTKSALIAGHAHRRGSLADVTALDLFGWKIETLVARMEALSVAGVVGMAVDATDPAALDEAVPVPADVVLLDAPCSGTGTMRRHPEKRWRLKTEDLEPITALQRRLISACSRLVRPGGFMVYSTCSILPVENAGIVSWFLGGEGGAQFQMVDAREYVDPAFERCVSAEGWFQSMPEPGGPDGHFAAVMRRRTAQ